MPANRYDEEERFKVQRREFYMCTRFVYNGNDMITGFNFDIDLQCGNTE